MSQYLIVTEALKAQVGADWANHIIAVTDHEKGNLIKLAKENGFITFYIPDGVGGRFSRDVPGRPRACGLLRHRPSRDAQGRGSDG